MRSAQIESSADGSKLYCVGEWTNTGMQDIPARFPGILRRTGDNVQIVAEKIQNLDTAGAVSLCRLIALAQEFGKKINIVGLKNSHQFIFELVQAQYQPGSVKNLPAKPVLNSLSLLGWWVIEKIENTYGFLSFIGEVLIQFVQISRHGLRHLGRASLKIN